MEKYISKNAAIAEIERLKKDERWCQVGKDTADVYYTRGFRFACERIINALNTLEAKRMEEYEQPEHSCFEYKCGKKPYWNIGDTLAYYELCSDIEGEHILGKVVNVRFDDEEQSDWIYTFEDGRLYDEELLLENVTYKKK